LFPQTKATPPHKTPAMLQHTLAHKVLFAEGSIPTHKDPVGAHYPPDLEIAMGSLHQNPSLQLENVQIRPSGIPERSVKATTKAHKFYRANCVVMSTRFFAGPHYKNVTEILGNVVVIGKTLDVNPALSTHAD